MFNFDYMEKDSFASWFDSPYYHVLYKNRDDNEAEKFITNITNHLQLPKKSRLLDLACGKGRHSVTLHKLGYDVVGVDLSPNSINAATQYSKDLLEFRVHDMREAMSNEKFDGILNLFTSFGYFDSMEDNRRVIQAMYTMLREKGVLVIDFMNATNVINSLVLKEVKVVDNITFNIQRKFDGKHIFKNIQFTAENKSFNYTERVQAIRSGDFHELLTQNGFQILCTFGDFDLSPFEEKKSDRLIIVAQRK